MKCPRDHGKRIGKRQWFVAVQNQNQATQPSLLLKEKEKKLQLKQSQLTFHSVSVQQNLKKFVVTELVKTGKARVVKKAVKKGKK